MDMNCVSCKFDLPEGSKFCLQCGSEQPKPEPKLEPEPEPIKKVLTAPEACEFLRISRCQLYRLAKSQKIPYFQIGSHKRFLTEQLIEWASNGGATNTVA